MLGAIEHLKAMVAPSKGDAAASAPGKGRGKALQETSKRT